jgi:hypothetical protein
LSDDRDTNGGNGVTTATLTTTDTAQLLRRALLFDGATCAASGVLLALAASPLADLFGLPVELLRGVGLILLPVAAAVLYVATREVLPRPAVWGIVGLNLLWALASLLLLATGWVEPTGGGYLFVVLQALMVAAIAELQIVGLRRAP